MATALRASRLVHDEIELISAIEPRGKPIMFSEIDLQTAAQGRQADLLNEAATRRLLRTSSTRVDEPAPAGRRLQTLLRRLAGAPTFA
jgi:hypothetical protein